MESSCGVQASALVHSYSHVSPMYPGEEAHAETVGSAAVITAAQSAAEAEVPSVTAAQAAASVALETAAASTHDSSGQTHSLVKAWHSPPFWSQI